MYANGEQFFSSYAEFCAPVPGDRKFAENLDTRRRYQAQIDETVNMYSGKLREGLDVCERISAEMTGVAARPNKRSRTNESLHLEADVQHYVNLGLDQWRPVTDSAGHFLGTWPYDEIGGCYLMYETVGDLMKKRPTSRVVTSGGRVKCKCKRNTEIDKTPQVYLFSTAFSSFDEGDWPSSSLHCQGRA